MAARGKEHHRFLVGQPWWAWLIEFLVVAVFLAGWLYAVQTSWTNSFKLDYLGDDVKEFRTDVKGEFARLKKALVAALLKTNPDAVKDIIGNSAFSLGLDAYKEGKFSVASVLWEPLAAEGNEYARIALEEMRPKRKSAALSYQEIHSATAERIAMLKAMKNTTDLGEVRDAAHLAQESQEAYQAGDKTKALGLISQALWSTVAAESKEGGAEKENPWDDNQSEKQYHKLDRPMIKNLRDRPSDLELKKKQP